MGNRVVFEENGGYIMHVESQRCTPLRLDGKLYYMDLWIQVPEELVRSSPFYQAAGPIATTTNDHCVSPNLGSRDLYGGGDDDDEILCGVCMEQSDLMFNDDEEPNDAEQPRMLTAPSPPSRQEALEHAMTHLPYRNWCPFCVRGKAKAHPHRSVIDKSDHEIPTVAFD